MRETASSECTPTLGKGGALVWRGRGQPLAQIQTDTESFQAATRGKAA